MLTMLLLLTKIILAETTVAVKRKEVKMKNIIVRRAAAANGVRLWQIADNLGMSDASFSRKLRRELPEEEQQKILAIIDNIAKEAANGDN